MVFVTDGKKKWRHCHTDVNMDTAFIRLSAQPRISAPSPPKKYDLTEIKTWKLTSKY